MTMPADQELPIFVTAPGSPGYWKNEQSGDLQPAVHRFLLGVPLDEDEVEILRAYFEQWIMAPVWAGELVEQLRADVAGLADRAQLEQWMHLAVEAGLDPL